MFEKIIQFFLMKKKILEKFKNVKSFKKYKKKIQINFSQCLNRLCYTSQNDIREKREMGWESG
jgi:hypothetical protein